MLFQPLWAPSSHLMVSVGHLDYVEGRTAAAWDKTAVRPTAPKVCFQLFWKYPDDIGPA